MSPAVPAPRRAANRKDALRASAARAAATRNATQPAERPAADGDGHAHGGAQHPDTQHPAPQHPGTQPPGTPSPGTQPLGTPSPGPRHPDDPASTTPHPGGTDPAGSAPHPPASIVIRVPIFDWLPGYTGARLRGDLLAGIAVAALAVPQALGYAAVAGVPVQVGLYTLAPALLAYAVFGSSRRLVVGPVSTIAVLTGTIVAGLAHGDPARAQALTAALALMAGAALVLLGMIRVGWVAEFLSAPIVTGFVSGLVALVIVGELPNLLGITVHTTSVFAKVQHLIGHAGQTSLATLALSVIALAVLVLGRRLARRVPWSLCVLVGAIVAQRLGHLSGHGIAVIGTVPTGLPLPGLPHLEPGDLGSLVTGAVAVAVVGLAEGLTAARLFGARHAERVEADTELVANGFADLASGLFGGLPVAGSLSKTAVADRAGARTQVSGLVAAALALGVLVSLAGLVADLPKAVLSAIVVSAVVGLIDVRAFQRYARVQHTDLLSALVAFGGVLIVGPLNGLLVAIAQSLLGLVYRSVQVHVEPMGKVPGEMAAWGSLAGHPERLAPPGLLVLRLSGPLFWPNAEHVHDRVLKAALRAPVTALVLDLEATHQLDTTSADVLARLVRALRHEGIDLYLAHVFADARVVLERSGLLADLGPGHVWHSIAAAVKSAKNAPAPGLWGVAPTIGGAIGGAIGGGAGEAGIGGEGAEGDDDLEELERIAVETGGPGG